MRRWHPDKFLQKLGDRIVEEEKEEVADDDDDYNNYDDGDNCNDDNVDIVKEDICKQKNWPSPLS